MVRVPLGYFKARAHAESSLPVGFDGYRKAVTPGNLARVTHVNNPFFAPSRLEYQMPPFDRIEDEHYMPAFDRGILEQQSEVTAIANSAEPATFDNTVVALERSGRLLHRVSTVFFNKVSADTSPTLQDIQSQIAPKLAAHSDKIKLDTGLFVRIDSLYQRRNDLDLDSEALRLLERYHLDFVRDGAQLSVADKDQLKALNEQLSRLGTQFSQRQLAATNAAAVLVDDASELAGMGADAIETAASAAKARGESGKYLLTFNNFTHQRQLGSISNQKLRQRIYQNSIARGNDGSEHDSSALVLELARLRAQRAQLLGYSNHASYVIADQTAGDANSAVDILTSLAPKAISNARAEARERCEVLGTQELEPWDWLYANELLRKKRFNFDTDAMRPYLELERVLHDGVFYAASQLYGITFTERFDLPTYHPQVRVFEVQDTDGSPLGLFCADYYTRDTKNGGAWMNSLVRQSRLDEQLPVVVNNLNIPLPPAGQATLLSFTEVTTMFHEFGHALHGLFSQVTYPRFSGTSVPRDFVEFPSQVNELWSTWPQVLANFAVHHETGDTMPPQMLDRQLLCSTSHGTSCRPTLCPSLKILAKQCNDLRSVCCANTASTSNWFGHVIEVLILGIFLPADTQRDITHTFGARSLMHSLWSGSNPTVD